MIMKESGNCDAGVPSAYTWNNFVLAYVCILILLVPYWCNWIIYLFCRSFAFAVQSVIKILRWREILVRLSGPKHTGACMARTWPRFAARLLFSVCCRAASKAANCMCWLCMSLITLWKWLGHNIWVWEEEEQTWALWPECNRKDSEGYPGYFEDETWSSEEAHFWQVLVFLSFVPLLL
jgi:hypothetical protein